MSLVIWIRDERVVDAFIDDVSGAGRSLDLVCLVERDVYLRHSIILQSLPVLEYVGEPCEHHASTLSAQRLNPNVFLS